ncbi:hypothetical protein [Alloscardovia omnicolens]
MSRWDSMDREAHGNIPMGIAEYAGDYFYTDSWTYVNHGQWYILNDQYDC